MTLIANQNQKRWSNRTWGLIGIVLSAAIAYFAFGGKVADDPYELKAVVRAESDLAIRSAVRTAGVEVGKVTKVESISGGAGAAEVTMQIEDEGLPIHKDARLKIRARLIFDGNYFIELFPGTPESPKLDSGATLAADRTDAPVSLDRVLSDLPATTRSDLQVVLRGFGSAVNDKPTAAEDADQPQETKGLTLAESANHAIGDAPEALRGAAISTRAFLGTDNGDLTRSIRSTRTILSALASRETELADLITNFNLTAAAFADRNEDLSASIRELRDVAAVGRPAFNRLDSALEPTSAFARKARPGIRELPATIDAAGPWITQLRALVSKAELGGLIDDIAPTTTDLGVGVGAARSAVARLDRIDLCLMKVLLPTGDIVINDAGNKATSTQEFFQSLTGAGGAFQNFDGNGPYTRVQAGGGGNLVSSSALPAGQGPLRGNLPRPAGGTRPAFAGEAGPPINSKVQCHTNPVPDLNSAPTGGTP